MSFDRITSNPALLNGQPCIRNSRLAVKRVLAALATYGNIQDVKQDYPELENEDIRQAIQFAIAQIDDEVIDYAHAA